MDGKTTAVSSADVTVLWAVEAELHGNLKPTSEEDETQGERPHLWTEGWERVADYHSWKIEVAEAQDYLVSVTCSRADEWTHEEPDTEIPRPLYDTPALLDHLKRAVERRIPVSMNVGIYQDGSVSEATLEQLRAVKASIRAG